MIYIITTKTGSVYEVDDKAMTWKQIKSTSSSGTHRSTEGNIKQLGMIVIGQPLILSDDNILPGHHMHLLVTSPIVAVKRQK